MSIWSRWFKGKDKRIVQPLAAPAALVDSVSAVRKVVPRTIETNVLPVQWPGSEDVSVAQQWLRVWQQSRDQAQQWLVDQQQQDAQRLQVWATCAIGMATTSDVRQRLLEVIFDAEVLKPMLAVFKHKDKSVYKQLKNRLMPETRVKNIAPDLASAVQAVQVSVLAAQVQPVDVDTTDYVGCSQQCQQTLILYQAFSELSPHHLLPLQALLVQQQAIQQRALQATEPTAEQLRFLQDFQRVEQLAAALMRWLSSLDELQALCLLPVDDGVPSESTVAVLQNKSSRLQILLEQLDWPLAGDSLLLLRQAKQQLKQLPDQLAACQQQLENTQTTWRDQLPLLEQYLQAGDVSKADEVLKVLQRLLLKPKQKQQLQGLVQRLHELKDWQGFVELPKKQQLIDAIQQLVDTPLPVEQQAQRIKHLQAQWQLLNISEHHVLWQQFKQLAEAAYLPCKQFYAAQKQQRLDNANTREKLCVELEQYVAAHDWAKADWAKVRQTQQLAKQSWRAAFPVERHLEKPLQQRFDAVMQQLQRRQDEFQQQQTLKRLQRKKKLEEQAEKRQQQMVLAEQKKQQEHERQLKRQAQQLAHQQRCLQLDQTYLTRLQQHNGGEETSHEDEKQKRRLVIQLEVLAGLPSPASEQALRMQVQVERLAKNFQGTESKLASHHDCVERWCEGLRLTCSEEHQDLLARMQLAYQQYSEQHYLPTSLTVAES
jgi:hypothetical protein